MKSRRCLNVEAAAERAPKSSRQERPLRPKPADAPVKAEAAESAEASKETKVSNETVKIGEEENSAETGAAG